MFHLRQTDICWKCRMKVPAVDNVKAAGVHHLCPSCGKFWVISHCKENGHKPLVKLGSKSFHEVKKTDEWNCTCRAALNSRIAGPYFSALSAFYCKATALKSRTFVLKSRTMYTTMFVRDLNAKVEQWETAGEATWGERCTGKL